LIDVTIFFLRQPRGNLEFLFVQPLISCKLNHVN